MLAFGMASFSFNLFDTAFGRAGLAWGEFGVRAVAFPGLLPDSEILNHLRRHAPEGERAALPDEAQSIVDRITVLFAGADPDFSDVRLDWRGAAEFDCAVWSLTLLIPRGAVRTYGDLARDLGDVAFSRRVGQALGRNPLPVIVPCHRIVGADGKMTGFSAPGGAEAKRRLLRLEGALEPDLFD